MFKTCTWFNETIAFAAPLFNKTTWAKVQLLTVGAILAVRKRTITALLNIVGLGTKTNYAKYHHVLNRAQWSLFKGSRLLLTTLVNKFAPEGPLLLGLDDTLERRRGAKINAKGVYRDPVRSSKGHFVKSTGLRWLCLMLLAPIPFAQRVWALPFLTVLAPSERYATSRGRPHYSLSDRAYWMLLNVKHWLPARKIVVLTDGGFAVLKLLSKLQAQDITAVTRIRLDAGLYERPRPRNPGQKGRPRVKGQPLQKLSDVLTDKKTVWTSLTLETWYGEKGRTVEYTSGEALWHKTREESVYGRWVLLRDPAGKFKPQALFCTDQEVSAETIVQWFPQRWQVEVTFEESRAHLGVETGRGWSDLTIQRTTPLLMGLFSVVTLLAQRLHEEKALVQREQAWYSKEHLAFSDALSNVRRKLWEALTFGISWDNSDTVKIPRNLFNTMSDALCYAA